jgi:RNA polymerase primary sigma factor
LQEVGKPDLLTNSEEAELARRIKKGDREALNKLVCANLRFVISVARHYQNQGVPLSDLISEGNIGLIEAAKRFDQTKGFRFISYAVWWIRQSILAALAKQSRIVRLPLNKIAELQKMSQAIEHYVRDHHRSPQTSEIAEQLKMGETEASELFSAFGRHLSLNGSPTNDGNALTLLNTLPNEKDPPPDENVLVGDLSRQMERAISTLSSRQAEVVRMYYGLAGKKPQTLKQIGKHFGLSRERVRQIKKQALEKLRHACRKRLLEPYLE